MKWEVPQDYNSILEIAGSEFLIALFYEDLSIYFRLYTALVPSLLLIKKVLLLNTRGLFVWKVLESLKLFRICRKII